MTAWTKGLKHEGTKLPEKAFWFVVPFVAFVINVIIAPGYFGANASRTFPDPPYPRYE